MESERYIMKKIRRVGIAGAGTMGASMAETFAKYGYEVILYDLFPEALKKSEQIISLNQQTEISTKLVSKAESEKLMQRIEFTPFLNDLKDVDFLIEAIIEDLKEKQKFWTEASVTVGEKIILASNTSGLSITKIAEAIKNPERFAGMHWVNPPHIIPLIEIVKGEKTQDRVIKEIYDLCQNIDKKPVIVKDAPGFVLNRIQLAILRECLYIADCGIASVEDIDKVMKYALGIRYACLGPFEVADHGGLDVFNSIAEYLFKDLCDEKQSFSLLKQAIENNNLGIKTGKGFYDYSDGKDKEAIIYRNKMYTKISQCIFSS